MERHHFAHSIMILNSKVCGNDGGLLGWFRAATINGTDYNRTNNSHSLLNGLLPNTLYVAALCTCSDTVHYKGSDMQGNIMIHTVRHCITMVVTYRVTLQYACKDAVHYKGSDIQGNITIHMVRHCITKVVTYRVTIFSVD